MWFQSTVARTLTSVTCPPWTYNHVCFVEGLTAQSAADGETPLSGELFYYLVTGDDASCPESTLGPDSDGVDRPNASPCPTP